MTTFLDATPLIELFTDGPTADGVSDTLGREACAATSVNLAEAVYYAVREHEVSIESIRSLVESRVAGLIDVVPVTEEHAWRAVQLRQRHYHARRSALSWADCVLLAAAREGDTIVTADRALARAAEAEGIEVVPVPDASGRRP